MVHEKAGECGMDSAHTEGVEIYSLLGCLVSGWD